MRAMLKPTLSILIPTYNRKIYLERLLLELQRQLDPPSLYGDIEVVIGDNFSTDGTEDIATRFVAQNPLWKFYRRVANLGLDGNTFALLSESSGRYRWIIGDDDLPRKGLVRFVVEYIRTNTVSLLYLPSKWGEDIDSFDCSAIASMQFIAMRSLDYSRRMNIWTTFLSSWIFNADQLFSGLVTVEEVSANKGTQLLQLGCILPLLTLPSAKLLVSSEVCIYATSGNTGGYSVLETFLVNYPRLVVAYTRKMQPLRRALIGPSLASYMPSLILAVRAGKRFRDAGDSSGIFWQSIRYLWSYPSFWLTCAPLILIPDVLLRLLRRIHVYFRRYCDY
jgi:glycosyltransferase involved in cell wall biosynthesis